MVDKTKIESIVAETMASNADIQGVIVCDSKGKVIFGHTITADVQHPRVAELAVKISATSAQLAAGVDKGGLKEVSIAADQGLVLILGDVKLVLVAIAGEAARESMGLLRIALKRALINMVS
jgi:predicted regulator of Ras-like GTPase activity (Roadblock/LC7/MglB family)